MIMATAMGLLITTVWAAALGQNASTSLFAVFFGFYASYAAFVLGVVHGWYGIAPSGVTKATDAWLICWLGPIMLLTLTTLRLPWSFTLLLGLVHVALVLLYLERRPVTPAGHTSAAWSCSCSSLLPSTCSSTSWTPRLAARACRWVAPSSEADGTVT